MKHTLKGQHGHLLAMTEDGPQNICVSRSQAAKAEWEKETEILRNAISRKYKVCRFCFNQNYLGVQNCLFALKRQTYECSLCRRKSVEKHRP